MNLSPADYAILGALAVSLVFGMVRGFMREALSLLAWLGGLWLAWKFADHVKPMLGGLLTDEPQRTWVARALILASVLLVSWIIAEVIEYFIHQSGLSVTVDRALGAVFGLIRGVVLVSLLAMLGTLVKLDEVRWWQKSTLLPYAVTVSEWIDAFARTAIDSAKESLK
jgi:membrane protein required for colicin V production